MTKKPNLLTMQSGGPTPVINRSLFGIVQEAFDSDAFGQVYGAVHGLEGLVDDRLEDLGKVSKASWRRIAASPGAALGSTRRKLTTEDVGPVLKVLRRRGIELLIIVGGNDSAATGHALAAAAASAGVSLTVMNVPKTIDNDLMVTDHCPGYGSAARFVVLATMGSGRDAEAMGRAAPVTILEVMGRDAGWLAASSALARRDERDAPHVICVPEVPVDEDRFLDTVEDACSRFGYALAVVAENARGPDGVLGAQGEPLFVDDFGHPYFDGASRYLATAVARRLRTRARYEAPGTIQRSMAACVSRTDAQEAEAAGRAAVRYALDGRSDEMVTLVRAPDGAYSCSTGVAPLADVADRVRTMPDEYLDRSTGFVTPEFLVYLRPLIGGPLPEFGRIG